MKKVLAIIIALVFLLGIAGTAFASGNSNSQDAQVDQNQSSQIDNQTAAVTGDTNAQGNHSETIAVIAYDILNNNKVGVEEKCCPEKCCPDKHCPEKCCPSNNDNHIWVDNQGDVTTNGGNAIATNNSNNNVNQDQQSTIKQTQCCPKKKHKKIDS